MKRLLYVFFFIGLIGLIWSRQEYVHHENDLLVTSYDRTLEAFDSIKSKKESLGIDLHDSSGMIGDEFTPITTTLGALEAKRTSVNPNFTSVIVDYLRQLNLEEASRVGLNLSSSFPALNLQTIIVLEEMGYKPVIISSVGASTHGATDPLMTYQDMEMLLYEQGLIHHKSSLVSPGGDRDLGTNMDPLVLSNILNRQDKVLIESDYDLNLKTRLDIYGSLDAFINIGGNYMSTMENDLGYHQYYGIINNNYNYSDRGLIGYYLSRKVPVIHLLNIKDIALENELPIDPSYPIAFNPVKSIKYHPIFFLMTLLSLITIVLEYGYVKRKREQSHIRRIIEQQSMV